jgi:hypothetical protein
VNAAGVLSLTHKLAPAALGAGASAGSGAGSDRVYVSFLFLPDEDLGEEGG